MYNLIKSFALIILYVFVAGCATMPNYPDSPGPSGIPEGEKVTAISMFPKELKYMGRDGGLFDLSQDTYEDFEGDLNDLIVDLFPVAYSRLYSDGLSEYILSEAETVAVSKLVWGMEELSETEKSIIKNIRKGSSIRFVFIALPSKGASTTLAPAFIVDTSLSSYVIDPATISGPSVKCDTMIALFDFEKGKTLGKYRVAENWIRIKSVEFKRSYQDYSDEEKATITNGIKIGAEKAWAKGISKLIKHTRS